MRAAVSDLRSKTDRLFSDLSQNAGSMSPEQYQAKREAALRFDSLADKVEANREVRQRAESESKQAFEDFLSEYGFLLADLDAQIAAAESRRLAIADRLRDRR